MLISVGPYGFRHHVRDGKALLDIDTAESHYQIAADYVLACDGNKSFIRNQLNLDFKGRVFEDNFLIADVRLKHDHPNERYFWFDPPFNPGRTALLHKQPDDVWRLDFQLGWDIDREEAVKPENVETVRQRHVGGRRRVRGSLVLNLYISVPPDGTVCSWAGDFCWRQRPPCIPFWCQRCKQRYC